MLSAEAPSHGLELGLCFLPFLLLCAIFQQSASGIETVVIAVNVHAAE